MNKIRFSTIEHQEIVSQIKSAADSGAEYFLHLGWPASSICEDYRTSQKNFDALEKTLVAKRACVKFGISFIGVGSVVDRFPIPGNTYSLTKYVARQVFSNEIRKEKMTWLRPHYIFNLNSWPKFLSNPKNEKITIYDDSPRDYIHLNDVIRGIESVIQLDIRGEVDLGSQILKRPSDLCTALNKKFVISTDIVQESKIEFQSAVPNEKLSPSWHAWDTLEFFKGVI